MEERKITPLGYIPHDSYPAWVLDGITNKPVIFETRDIPLLNPHSIISSIISEERGVPNFMIGLISKILGCIEKQKLRFDFETFSSEFKTTKLDSNIFNKCFTNSFLSNPKLNVVVHNVIDSYDFEEIIKKGGMNQLFIPDNTKLSEDRTKLEGAEFDFNIIYFKGRMQTRNYEYISHEILHAYDEYNKLLNGVSFRDEELNIKRETYVKMMRDNNEIIKNMGRALYYSDNAEQNAFITQSFFQFKECGVDEGKNRENYKNTGVYKIITGISNTVETLNNFSDAELGTIKKEMSLYSDWFKQDMPINRVKKALLRILTRAEKNYSKKFFKVLSLYIDKNYMKITEMKLGFL